MPRVRVIVSTDSYRMPKGTIGTVLSRGQGMYVIDFGTGFGVLMEDEVEGCQEGIGELLE